MKKIILSVTSLLSLVTMLNAADAEQPILNSAAESKKAFSSVASSIAVSNYAAALEENTRLRIETAELSSKVENLVSMLDYRQMMHATISNLQNVSFDNAVADSKSQMDYAQMMNAVLVKLASINANSK